LIKLDGATLTGPAELRHQIQKHEDGDKVSLTYKRGGKSKTVEVELVERHSKRSMFFSEGDYDYDLRTGDRQFHVRTPRAPKVFTYEDDDDEIAFAGIVMQELGEGLQEYFKVENGALISEVVKDSPAESAGLKAGDVLVKIGSRDIDDTGDVHKAIRKYDPGEEIDFVIYRDGSQKTIKVKLTSREDHYGSKDTNIMRFGLNNGTIDGLIVMPDGDIETFSHDLSEYFEEIDLRELEESLEELQWEIKDLPNINMDLSIDPASPMFEMNFDQARAIRNDSWWKKSWHKMKSKLEFEFEELKKNLEQLKFELKKLQEEFKAKML
jgi:hypothetical protein